MSINLSLFEPVSEWQKPGFPELSAAKRVAIDLETCDPQLKAKGPGTFRGDGFPVGISIASDTGHKGYYPFAQLCGGNMDKENVIRYFKGILKRSDLEVVGAHISYDLEWLWSLGIQVNGKCRDVQIAEPLLNEESLEGYSLEVLSKKYLGTGKDEALLLSAASAYGIDPKFELWKLHAKYVGQYAEQDSVKTLLIYEKQLPLLRKHNLESIHDLESNLIPILLQMRIHGVRVNLDLAEQYSKEWDTHEKALRSNLKAEVGRHIDVWSGNDIARICRERNIPFKTTEKGNPSFDKLFFKHNTNPFFKTIGEIRNINRLRTVFLNEIILGSQIKGRIHAEFHQLRKDDGGTRTGRFSSSNPNLQQIPARDKLLAPKIRSLFIPEEEELWAKLDYSQQEPRILTHYGYITKLRGADKIRESYLADKKSDFYTLVAREARLERKPAKDLTLGRCYGEGKDKMARDLGIPVEEAMRILKIFDEANPFIKELSDCVMGRADQRGYIVTLLGRRRHFDFWEPARRDDSGLPLRKEAAESKWPDVRLKRAWTYKALNALIQGSAADMTKAAMLLVYKELGKIPLMQVHDELNYSVKDEFTATSIQYRMENCVDITVPILAELELGKHWK